MEMNSFAKGLMVGLAGLVSSVAMAFLDVYLSRLLGFSIFTAMWWFVIPGGAIILGGVAASGYYFASKWLSHRPSKALLFQMIAIAGVTQFLIYYLAFATSHLADGRPVSAALAFGQYIDAILTTGHIQIVLAYVPIQPETGEVGRLGYVMALIQFAGFLLGGAGVWGKLSKLPFCPSCHTYRKKLGSNTRHFFNRPSATKYYERALSSFNSKDAFLATLADGAQDEVGRKNPSFRIQLHLFGCPQCKDQELDSTVYEADANQRWRTRPRLAKRLSVPRGVDLSQGFARI
jgi:hypothetical protein